MLMFDLWERPDKYDLSGGQSKSGLSFLFLLKGEHPVLAEGIYIYIYIHTYVYMYYIHVYTYIYMYRFVMCVYMYIYIYIYT